MKLGFVRCGKLGFRNVNDSIDTGLFCFLAEEGSSGCGWRGVMPPKR